MRIVNHDYAGHPFQVQLSRALARRGHDVLHVYSASNQTPHGALARRDADPARFEVDGIALAEPFQKWNYLKRRGQELEYARLVAARIHAWRPDVVISGNTPTEAQRVIQGAAFERASGFVFWVQDVYSMAVHKILRRKIPLAGDLVGRAYMAIERGLLRRSDAVILITEDFRPLMERWGVEAGRVHVIPNWAPLGDMPLHPKANDWARAHSLEDAFCFLYSGTLGMKHNPDLLLQLALHFREDKRVRVVVASEGPGPDWLRAQRDEHGLDNLDIMGWQPFEAVPEMLAAADVLVAILEPDAGVFSVPSKVLTYLCAERALLLAVPPENLAARLVADIGAGRVVPPDATEAFVEAAAALMADDAARAAYGQNARRYAEAQFDIAGIADRFEEVLAAAGA
ncbi:MAG: glycosyltransferase family 4 protein [Candidatus Hydrogenedentes bacterium]|nr:glycosyltransferase family 4 protein [Candidatus Hydrogenedentota bacterium]